MTTFGQIAYAVLDLLKERTDDAYYTEEHVLFLAKAVRATLLERKYKGARNIAYNPLSEENRQRICFNVEPASLLPGGCSGQWLVSDTVIPEVIPGLEAFTCTHHDLLQTNVTWIPRERMPYVGHNRWLRNIIYACRSRDGKIYLHGLNPQMLYLKRMGLTAVYSDPEEATRLSDDACRTGKCDLLNMRYPLEDALIASLVEIVVSELSGSRFVPEDKDNNASDGFGEGGDTPVKNTKPVERTEEK